ncbi:sulfite exporter TauE/SafE family protein [Candidatus Woesearchaeota archaeon]|nr:sulfite exporter TauE/SafE family protein [Candidatus Woesearchaeota archaeon]
MKKTFSLKGMHCNSCSNLIENKLQDKVNNIEVSYSKETAEIDFDETTISETEIKEQIKKLGYELKEHTKKKFSTKNYIITGAAIIGLLALIFLFKYLSLPSLQIPDIGKNTSLVLLFLAGILTGFHCISMCGGFVLSYMTKNAIKGHNGFKQHLIYGGAKVFSYAFIGGIFGFIGGIIAFSIQLRGIVAILAGVFMIFYALNMFGIKFFKRFQFNPKFLTKASSNISSKTKGPYLTPFITGLLNGLFIACGPLQAMYLYATGTGGFILGAISLAAFGLGTLPIMLGFGSLASVISHKTTKRILTVSAVIVLILGLVMLNRGLSLVGSDWNFSTIKEKVIGTDIDSTSSANIIGDYQEVNMEVSASGYSPNSFVLKKDIPVKWNIDVTQLTGCNEEIVLNEYDIYQQLEGGLNVIEFTPTETGTITFTCGMGMLRGSFIVTESGTATDSQIKSAAPSSGGSCGMGCGCGG